MPKNMGEDKVEGISQSQLQDIIKQLSSRELAREEQLFRFLSQNPNYPRYTFIENLFDLAGVTEGFMRETVLDSIKAKGIRELTIKKFDSLENIVMATTPATKPEKKKENQKEEVDLGLFDKEN